MKYLVVSDIHGGEKAAEKIVQLNAELHPDAILCLGDVLYHGPRNDLPDDYAPKKVIALLNPLAHQIFAVKGNCDGEVDQMVLNFPVLASYNNFLLGTRHVFMTHGHTYSPSNHPELKSGDLFLSGHTHIPTVNQNEGVYFLNPGSMTLPKENHPKSYGILDDNGFTVYTLDDQEYMKVLF